MNRFIIVLICFAACFAEAVAQDCDCYNSTRKQALELMSQGKYTKAISFLTAAKDCPDKPESNDLDRKIKECRDAIKRIEEERKREESERLVREQEAQWRNKAYMQIKGISFGNTTKSDSLINNYGATLYASDIQYLSARLKYDGMCTSSKSLKLGVKIFKPDGTMMNAASSPSGYTYTWDVTVYPGTERYCNIGGWGSSSRTTYSPGTYRWEVWYENMKIYESTSTINSKQGYVSRLTVDGKNAVSTSFSSSGGSETFFVSTDASSWTTWGIPSWCTVENKTGTSFKLVCKPNTSSSERKDYMKIKAGDKEVRIDISQPGDTYTMSASIKSINVDYDVYQNGAKGMRIHVNFDVHNCKSVPCRCVAYFYFTDGTALNDYNGSYKTSDGKVSVGTDFTPNYTNTNFSDLQLFMPYSELHLTSNKKHNCYFEVNFYRKSDSKFFDAEQKHYFDITY